MALPICISSLNGPTLSILYSYNEAAWLIFETKIWAFKLHDEVRKLITCHAAVPIMLNEIST